MPLAFSREKIGRKAIISCGVNEYHQLGARIVADMIELKGWDVYFLGANTPTADYIQLIDEKQPDLVGLSVSIFFNIAALEETLQEIKSFFPNQEIILGGQAFRWGGHEITRRFNNMTLVLTLTELESIISTYAGAIKHS